MIHCTQRLIVCLLPFLVTISHLTHLSNGYVSLSFYLYERRVCLVLKKTLDFSPNFIPILFQKGQPERENPDFYFLNMSVAAS